MDLIGSYHAMGYTVEAYFPEQEAPDAWTLWVVKDGRVVGEFTTRIVVDSVYGMDRAAMQRLEVAAEAVAMEVMRRESAGDVVTQDNVDQRTARTDQLGWQGSHRAKSDHTRMVIAG